MADSPAPESEERHPWQGRLFKVTALIWVGVFAMFTLWSFATPLWQSPDATSHEIMAYHVWRDITPDNTDVFANGVNSNANTDVPQGILDSAATWECMAYKGDVPATCGRPIGDDKMIGDYANSAGRNIPTYYLMTGWPSLFSPMQYFPYADRAAASAVAALFVAWAASAALTRRRPSLAVTGVVVSITPMVAYLGGAVNPNTLEITTGIALAACSMVFLQDGPDSWLGRVMFRRAMIAVTLMCAIRMLAPVWALVWALAFVVLATRKHWAHIFSRRGIGWFLLPVLACVVNVIWTFTSGLTKIQTVPKHDLTFLEAFQASRSFQESAMVTQQVGNFGWLDTPMANANVMVYVIAALFVMFAVATRLTRKELVLVLALAFIQHYLPIVMEAAQWNANGLVWQGRYHLPISVLVPIFILMLAANRMGPARADDAEDRVNERRNLVWIYPVAIGLLLYGHYRGMETMLRRYVSGYGGPLVNEAGWHPPLSPVLLLVLLAALLLTVWGSTTWLFLRDARRLDRAVPATHTIGAR